MSIPPPQPAPASFHTFFTDPSQSYARDLAQATAARARVRTVLKATRKAAQAGGQGDWTAALQTTSEYLPFLYAVLACVETDDLLLKAEPVFSWRSSLSSHVIKKSRPRIALPSLHYELAATLLTYALCLSNRSATLVASLGTYETSSAVSTADLKAHDETINTAAEMLCRSSGVLLHLAEVVLPRWEGAVPDGGRGRPVELTRDVVSALAKLALADANLLAIRRLLSRSLALSHTTTTPGPPLPKSHPSPSLLAKLHLNVYNLYDSARSLIKGAEDDVSPELRRYLSDGRVIAQSLSFKWLGVDAGENGRREKAGEALRWLEMAKSGLEDVKGKSKGVGMLKIGKGKKAGKERKGKVGEELDTVAAFASAYKKVNDTLHFQPVPSAAALLLSVASGVGALSAKAFVPPAPAFTTHAHDGPRPKSLPPPPDLTLAGLDLGADDDSSDEEDGAGGDAGAKEYFGAGSYW